MKTFKTIKSLYLIAAILVISVNVPAQFSANYLALSSSKTTSFAFDIDFNVSISKNVGELNWTAIKTIDILRYELEKSTDGEHFSYITAIAANVSTEQYTIRDNNLTEGVNYYRLKIVESSGEYYYSKPVSIDKNINTAKYKIMPNIVSDELLIWLPVNTQVSKATITDLAGRVVLPNGQIYNRTNLTTIQVAGLQTGIYKISLVTNDGATTNLSFSKK